MSTLARIQCAVDRLGDTGDRARKFGVSSAGESSTQHADGGTGYAVVETNVIERNVAMVFMG
ncbi:hypothetical protein ALI144C_17970 [Actinosynnema sp. ALI-1.44]|uniref:hypothetical protein n=1 Tax=Actinosynnema sp. ALI-1.44 TaxID=1933779 RepID=UPI00097BF910|nr:hypothetical protein [Actinosynnema sp. ALI-1.44]ONI82942.1 hypothetical protein ALI144C_17970 [Actinosynnema sp. ALI-1.44]